MPYSFLQEYDNRWKKRWLHNPQIVQSIARGHILFHRYTDDGSLLRVGPGEGGYTEIRESAAYAYRDEPYRSWLSGKPAPTNTSLLADMGPEQPDAVRRDTIEVFDGRQFVPWQPQPQHGHGSAAPPAVNPPLPADIAPPVTNAAPSAVNPLAPVVNPLASTFTGGADDILHRWKTTQPPAVNPPPRAGTPALGPDKGDDNQPHWRDWKQNFFQTTPTHVQSPPPISVHRRCFDALLDVGTAAQVQNSNLRAALAGYIAKERENIAAAQDELNRRKASIDDLEHHAEFYASIFPSAIDEVHRLSKDVPVDKGVLDKQIQERRMNLGAGHEPN